MDGFSRPPVYQGGTRETKTSKERERERERKQLAPKRTGGALWAGGGLTCLFNPKEEEGRKHLVFRSISTES